MRDWKFQLMRINVSTLWQWILLSKPSMTLNVRLSPIKRISFGMKDYG